MNIKKISKDIKRSKSKRAISIPRAFCYNKTLYHNFGVAIFYSLRVSSIYINVWFYQLTLG